jgi:hypothetical protein
MHIIFCLRAQELFGNAEIGGNFMQMQSQNDLAVGLLYGGKK